MATLHAHIIRVFVLLSAALWLAVAAQAQAPSLVAPGFQMPAPVSGLSPLAPPCETGPDSVNCSLDPFTDCVTTDGLVYCGATPPPDYSAVAIIDAALKELENRMAQLEACDAAGDETCAPPAAGSDTPCDEGAGARCDDPPDAPLPVEIAIGYIEGLLGDGPPEAFLLPPNGDAQSGGCGENTGAGCDGPDSIAGGPPAENPDTGITLDPDALLVDPVALEKAVACDALAEAQAERGRVGAALRAIANRKQEISRIYMDERARILSETTATSANLKATFKRLAALVGDLSSAREEMIGKGKDNPLLASRIKRLNKTLNHTRDLYDELQLAGKERLFSAYEKSINDLAPLWNRSSDLIIRAADLDTLIADLQKRCR